MSYIIFMIYRNVYDQLQILLNELECFVIVLLKIANIYIIFPFEHILLRNECYMMTKYKKPLQSVAHLCRLEFILFIVTETLRIAGNIYFVSIFISAIFCVLLFVYFFLLLKMTSKGLNELYLVPWFLSTFFKYNYI